MRPRIFIDGSEGTTGLRIYERFEKRDDIELITIDHELRKDPKEVSKKINESDITFLCLPDQAAIEAVDLIENENVRILDTSTAHRTEPGWSYGFPELSEKHKEAIAVGKRVAVPGCHATGFISLIYPLISAGVLKPDSLISSTSISGYSGGGKKAIAQYSDVASDPLLHAPRQYALAQHHKHMKEMKAIPGLANEPVFMPFICNFYSGMEVSVPLHMSQLNGSFSVTEILDIYRKHYLGSNFIKVAENDDELVGSNFLSACQFAGKDFLKIYVYGNEDRIVVTSLFDNLGKGASGAAIECMNIMLGFDETTGLIL